MCLFLCQCLRLKQKETKPPDPVSMCCKCNELLQSSCHSYFASDHPNNNLQETSPQRSYCRSYIQQIQTRSDKLSFQGQNYNKTNCRSFSYEHNRNVSNDQQFKKHSLAVVSFMKSRPVGIGDAWQQGKLLESLRHSFFGKRRVNIVKPKLVFGGTYPIDMPVGYRTKAISTFDIDLPVSRTENQF